MDMFNLDNFQQLIFVAMMTGVIAVILYCFKLHYEVDGIRIYWKEKKTDWFNLVLIMAAAFLIKLYFAHHYEGHGTDMNCFYAWSDMIFEHGFGEFYYQDAFTDYPPGYMALLWVIAAIRRIFSIETVSGVGRIMIKLFPILADMGTGFFVYRLAKKKFSEGSSLLLTLTYLLNPLVVLDSSIWGQTDSVFTFFVLLTCYLCMEQKRIPAYFAFIIGTLIKPQTLIFAPILIFTIVEQVFLHDFNKKKMLRDLLGGLAAIASFFLLAAPFGLEKVVSQYIDTLGSYEYCSVNAYNVWALFGKNWADQSGTLGFLEYRQWGTLAIIAAVGLSAFIFFKRKEDKSKYFLSMSVVVGTMFLFSVRMHERYLFPVVALTLFGFLLKPTKEIFFTYVGFSIVQFLNVGHVLYYFEEYDSTGPQGGIIGMTALLTLAIYAYLFFAIFTKTKLADLELPSASKSKGAGQKYWMKNGVMPERKPKEKKKYTIAPTKVMAKFTKWDWIVLGSILVVYSLFAFRDLGNTHAPENPWVSDGNGTEIVLDLGEEKAVDMLYAYLGNYEARRFVLDMSQDGVNYERVGDIKAVSVFCWNEMQANESGSSSYNLAKSYRYLRLFSQDNECVIEELAIKDKEGNIITPVNAADYPGLFDEQDEYTEISTFRDGTYFDEIYHARTAYEMTQDNVYCYENTHPPLGKYFISLGIQIFGMNPFGWRIVGVLFGIGMLPFMYLFGRRLFGGRTWAAGALTFLFAFDFMHFTQTRISTIDVYGTFFIIAMFYFMVQYWQTSFYDNPLWKTFLPLGASAIMMGLGCASKWTAVYAAAGLGVFFFFIMGVRAYEYYLAKKDPNGMTGTISHAHVIQVFKKNLLWTLAFCVLFFVIIAGGIYIASYVPFYDACADNVQRFADKDLNTVGTVYRWIIEFLQDHKDSPFWEVVGRMVKNQDTMFHYHAGLESSHPYSSTWYEWPTMIRPMFYYCKTLPDGLKEGISAFGNPLVWWAGIPAFGVMLYRLVRYRDKIAGFTTFAYMVQYIPWILVPRCTFAYHYFPSVPFLAMMIVYIMVLLVQQNKKWFKWAMIYLGAAFLLFLLFYPVLSGQPVEETFVRDGLRWLNDWVLVL